MNDNRNPQPFRRQPKGHAHKTALGKDDVWPKPRKQPEALAHARQGNEEITSVPQQCRQIRQLAKHRNAMIPAKLSGVDHADINRRASLLHNSPSLLAELAVGDEHHLQLWVMASKFVQDG